MSVENQLFSLIGDSNYTAALALLQANKELDINALDKEGSSYLMAATSDGYDTPERYTFIEKILSHPGFKHSNTPMTDDDSTPFSFAVFVSDAKQVNLMLQYQEAKAIDVIYDSGKLLYADVAGKVQRAYTALAKDPNSSLGRVLDKNESILASLLQAAVHHAIKTDDETLLQRLVDAGAKLYFPLKDGTFPMDLVSDAPDTKVHQWLKKYIQGVIAASPQATALAKKLKEEHQEELSQMLDDFYEETAQDIVRTFRLKETPEDTARTFNFFKSQVKETTAKDPDQNKPSSGPGVGNG